MEKKLERFETVESLQKVDRFGRVKRSEMVDWLLSRYKLTNYGVLRIKSCPVGSVGLQQASDAEPSLCLFHSFTTDSQWRTVRTCETTFAQRENEESLRNRNLDNEVGLISLMLPNKVKRVLKNTKARRCEGSKTLHPENSLYRTSIRLPAG